MQQRFKINMLTHDRVDPPAVDPAQLWDIAVIGEHRELDARSKAAVEYAIANALNTLIFRFDSPANQIRIEGEDLTHGKLRSRFSGVKSLLIEATTLSVPEILYIIAAATMENVQRLRLVYVEPVEYRRTIEGQLCAHRDFDLSDNRRYRSIPRYQTNLSDTTPGQAVFFLGYEGARFGQALEQEEELQNWRKHAVFGVPAFESGWEIDSMANNIQYLGERDQIQYAAASSVSAAYNLLCKLRHQDKEDKPILVAPLGTKPHAIGAILFLIEYDSMNQAIILYDHPVPSQECQ